MHWQVKEVASIEADSPVEAATEEKASDEPVASTEHKVDPRFLLHYKLMVNQ